MSDTGDSAVTCTAPDSPKLKGAYPAVTSSPLPRAHKYRSTSASMVSPDSKKKKKKKMKRGMSRSLSPKSFNAATDFASAHSPQLLPRHHSPSPLHRDSVFDVQRSFVTEPITTEELAGNEKLPSLVFQPGEFLDAARCVAEENRDLEPVELCKEALRRHFVVEDQDLSLVTDSTILKERLMHAHDLLQQMNAELLAAHCALNHRTREYEAVSEVNKQLMNEISGNRRSELVRSESNPSVNTTLQVAKKVKSSQPSSNKVKAVRLKMQVVPDDIILGALIGKGSSGAMVYECVVDGWSCALKQFQLKNKSFADIESFQKEVDILSQLPPHPHIVRYLFHFERPASICIGLQKYTGTLREYLDSATEALAQPTIAQIGCAVSKALLHLHEFQVVHCDVKANNVFLCWDSERTITHIAVGDFDAAHVIKTDAAIYSSGTPGFMPPEMISTSKAISYKSDVYSLGMLLFELMTREIPYSNLQHPFDITSATLEGKLPELTADVDLYHGIFKQLFKECCHMKSKKRPTMECVCFVFSYLWKRPDTRAKYHGIVRFFEQEKKKLVAQEKKSKISDRLL